MAETFTTWTAALSEAKTRLAQRDLTLASLTGPDGSSFQYRSINELRQLIGFLEDKAAGENATAGVATRRTFAKPMREG